jgi:hypothetical protein
VVSDVRERVRDFRITFALYVKKIFCQFHIKIKQDVHFTTLKRFKIICELKRALYGIKCVLRIFLTNMVEHTIEEKEKESNTVKGVR